MEEFEPIGLDKPIPHRLDRVEDWYVRNNEDRMNIAVGMCGGTVVSIPNTKGALEPAKDPSQLMQHVPYMKERANIWLFELLNKDSTENEPDDWVKMAKFANWAQNYFDGVLFTHGTDTLVWSATAIRFILSGNLFIPLALTGSQLPLTAYRTDAVTNIQDSIATLVEARKRSINEVMTIADRKIFRGNRSIKISESDFDFLDSPAYPILGKSTAYGIEFNKRSDIFTREVNLITLRSPLSRFTNRPLHEAFNRNIVSIQLTPLITNRILTKLLLDRGDLDGNVVLGSFGAGNTPERILPVIRYLTDQGTKVMITPIRAGADTAIIYENARKAVEVGGAIQARDMTMEASSVKLAWLLGQPEHQNSDRDTIKYLLLQSYWGEVTEETH